MRPEASNSPSQEGTPGAEEPPAEADGRQVELEPEVGSEQESQPVEPVLEHPPQMLQPQMLEPEPEPEPAPEPEPEPEPDQLQPQAAADQDQGSESEEPGPEPEQLQPQAAADQDQASESEDLDSELEEELAMAVEDAAAVGPGLPGALQALGTECMRRGAKLSASAQSDGIGSPRAEALRSGHALIAAAMLQLASRLGAAVDHPETEYFRQLPVEDAIRFTPPKPDEHNADESVAEAAAAAAVETPGELVHLAVCLLEAGFQRRRSRLWLEGPGAVAKARAARALMLGMDSSIGEQQLSGLRSSFDAFDRSARGYLSHAQAAAMLRSMLSHGHRDEYEILRKDLQVVVLRKVPAPPQQTERKEIAVATWGVVVEDKRDRMLDQPSSVAKENAADDHDGAVIDSSDDEPVASSNITEPTNANATGESANDANLTTGSADSNASSASGISDRSNQSSYSDRSNPSAAIEPEKEAETEHNHHQQQQHQEQQQTLVHRVWYAQFLCLASPLLGGPIAPERVLAMASPSSRHCVNDDDSGKEDRLQPSPPRGTFAVAVGACGGLAAWRLAATAPVATAVPTHNVNGQQVSSKPASLDLMLLSPYLIHLLWSVLIVRFQALD